MTPAPGWYPDPGGQPGLLRYWDGQGWTAATRPAPAPIAEPSAPRDPAPRRRSPLGWILGAAALVLVVVVTLVVTLSVRTAVVADPPQPAPPSGPVCPEAVRASASPRPPSGDRVSSGRLSYPRLAAPFSAPVWDRRVPFGRDVQTQQATVEAAPSGAPTWVAAVVIARLLVGDGFYGPQQGAEVVATCITGLFYGQTSVQRVDSRNEATTVDGRPAWLIEAHLRFSLPDIRTKGETMTVLVVDTGAGEAGLFYGSLPDTSPQFASAIRSAQAGLRVS